MTAFTGTSNDDDYIGTADADQFDMTQGGVDTVRGAGGDDSINFGEEMNGEDRVFGGSGVDGLVLEGSYGFGVVFDHSNFRSVEQILLFGDHVFALGFQDSALRGGQTMQIDVAFGVGQLFLFVDESSAAFDVFAGGQNDTIATGGGNDTISTGDGVDTILSGRGNDTIDAGDGDDQITFRTGELTAKDRIDGGDTAHINTVILDGDYSAGVTLAANTFSHITRLEFSAGNDYVIDLGKTTIGPQFAIDASGLGPANRIVFDGSHALGGGGFNLGGGAGGDSLNGGDFLLGRAGADRLEGRGGLDYYTYDAAAESTGPNYDTVAGFDTDEDLFNFSAMGVAVQAVDAKVTHGKLSAAGHFNSQLGNAIDAGALGASHAVVFQPDSGTLAGQIFVIADCNNTAGYQAGLDLVVRLVNPHHLAALAATDFFTI